VTDGRQAAFLQQIRHRRPDIIEVPTRYHGSMFLWPPRRSLSTGPAAMVFGPCPCPTRTY
jgi:hypothetical protein